MEKINVLNILKNAPVGLELYSPMYGKVAFNEISTDKRIKIRIQNSSKKISFITLDKYGKYSEDGECIIFPDKHINDWNIWYRHLLNQDLAIGKIIKDATYKGLFLNLGNGVLVSQSADKWMLNYTYDNPTDLSFADSKESKKFLSILNHIGYKYDEEINDIVKLNYFMINTTPEDFITRVLNAANKVHKLDPKGKVLKDIDISKQILAVDKIEEVIKYQ